MTKEEFKAVTVSYNRSREAWKIVNALFNNQHTFINVDHMSKLTGLSHNKVRNTLCRLRTRYGWRFHTERGARGTQFYQIDGVEQYELSGNQFTRPLFRPTGSQQIINEVFR